MHNNSKNEIHELAFSRFANSKGKIIGSNLIRLSNQPGRIQDMHYKYTSVNATLANHAVFPITYIEILWNLNSPVEINKKRNTYSLY